MKGLAVVDGDLLLSGGDYYTISGPTKITQDLTFALTDTYGSDPYHPYWGSILDRFIGLPLTAELQTQVTAEVTRVMNNYIAVQADLVNNTVAAGSRGLFDTSDVVANVEAINVQIYYDSINISVTLSTMAGNTVEIYRQVSV